MRIMSEKEYQRKLDENFKDAYDIGQKIGYRDALSQLKAEMREDIQKCIAEVSEILKKAFSVDIYEETMDGMYRSEGNLELPLIYSSALAELPTIGFRVTIRPNSPYLYYLKKMK